AGFGVVHLRAGQPYALPLQLAVLLEPAAQQGRIARPAVEAGARAEDLPRRRAAAGHLRAALRAAPPSPAPSARSFGKPTRFPRMARGSAAGLSFPTGARLGDLCRGPRC